MAELKIISMDEVAVEEVEWLWYPYIPYGKLTIIHGDGGEGKTTLILRLAALLSRGEKLPCDDTAREPIKIIYQTAEDGLGDTIKPRLLAGNADCSQIKVIDESEAALTMLDERVEKAIAETGARVIILDPMQAYIGATAIIIYGGIMNPAAAFMVSSESITLKTLFAYYVTGLPMDLVHAFGTALFIMLAAEPMLEKMDRIKVKYGLVE